MTSIDWKPGPTRYSHSKAMMGHHSLVTSIDWKLAAEGSDGHGWWWGHHSLVTSIDWKRWEHGCLTFVNNGSPLAGDIY